MNEKERAVIISNLDYEDICVISDLMQGSNDPRVHKFARKINKNLTLVRKEDLPFLLAFHKEVQKTGTRIKMI